MKDVRFSNRYWQDKGIFCFLGTCCPAVLCFSWVLSSAKQDRFIYYFFLQSKICPPKFLGFVIFICHFFLVEKLHMTLSGKIKKCAFLVHENSVSKSLWTILMKKIPSTAFCRGKKEQQVVSVEGFSALKQKTNFASQINQHQWEFLSRLTTSTATVALGGQTWCFKSFWADTIFTLIQVKWASKCLLELADLRSPLALCQTIYFCGSGGNLGGKKSILQYCWARMGCPYFFWMYNFFTARFVNTGKMVWLSYFCGES